MDCTKAEKLVLAKFSLKNEARIWWEAMGRVHEGDGIPTTFEVFKTEFEKKYVPNVLRDRKEAMFARLVQGQMLVADFEAKPSIPSSRDILLMWSRHLERKLVSFKKASHY